ncbi:MAG: SDR family oxidoreductase [Caulobacteraceae bacterium]|nr:SDR family oxidoreductase [Caulobacter sp.]
MPAALVTGAAKRIGRALALTCAEAGYDVAVHHRGDLEDAEGACHEVEARGRRAVRVQGDLSEPGAPERLVREAAEALGPLTLLVNSASAFDDDRLGSLDLHGWDAHMAANLRAPVFLLQAFAAQVPPEASEGEALCVNLLDQRVLRPNPQFFSYTLSKCALWAATRTAAQALAPRVRVNGVGPGPTLASVHQDAAAFAAEAAATPLQRPVSTDDLAGALRYLIGARAVTGQMIAVDSGQHLGWRTPDVQGD